MAKSWRSINILIDKIGKMVLIPFKFCQRNKLQEYAEFLIPYVHKQDFRKNGTTHYRFGKNTTNLCKEKVIFLSL